MIPGLLALLSIGTTAWFTRSDFFFQDDFVFLRQAQQSHFTLTYLREQLFQHFSPVSRLADYALAHGSSADYGWAKVVTLVLVGTSVIAFAWTVAALCRSRWRHALTFLFGQSLALLHLAGWWTATINILPATILGLVVIGAYVRFRQGRGARFGVITLVSFGVSLLTHEQSWLVLGYLFLLEVLIISWPWADRQPYYRPFRIRDAWWLWTGMAVLTALAVVNYLEFYYSAVKPRATVGQMVRFTEIMFGQSLAPSLTSFRPLHDGVVTGGAAWADTSIVAVVIVATCVVWRGAWRAWVMFLLSFLAGALMTGLNRVGLYGPYYGRSMFYVQAAAYLFPLCLGIAAALGGFRIRTDLDHPVRAKHLARPGPRYRRPGLVVPISLLALIEVCFVASARMQERQDPNDRMARAAAAYTGHLRHSAASAGPGLVIKDGSVPATMVLPGFAPYSWVSQVSDVVGIRLRTAPPGTPNAAVSPTGYVQPLSSARTGLPQHRN